MKQLILVASLAIFMAFHVFAQKSITLEDIWQNYIFSARGVPGFDFLNDGKTYTKKDGGKIQQYDFTSGNFVSTIFDVTETNGVLGDFDGYSFSEDETKILLSTSVEPIYRHSTYAQFYIWDRATKQLQKLWDGGKQRYATLNRTADKVAFIHDNDLYYKDLTTEKVTRITNDGAYNKIINGASDWVYEEEFVLVEAFQWSPDGKNIAFLRFDESEVKEFTMQMYNDELYPGHVNFKYPKVGEKNSVVTAHLYNLEKNRILKVETGTATDIYLPRIRWVNSNQVCVFRMNRHQNELELLLAEATTGKTKLLYKEKEDQYIAENMLDDINFLKDGKHFVMSSEREGWQHIYLHDMTGKLVKQLTKGNWDVTAFYGVDETNQMLYFQAAKVSPMNRHVYALSLKDGKEQQLSNLEGWNSASFSSTFDYYMLENSTANTPSSYAVFSKNGKLQRELENNERIKTLQKDYGVSAIEFFTFQTTDNLTLNGWMLKPANFDATKKYPVFMFLYGGPGSQQVTNQWKGQNYWWFQMLAQQGFIVACVDNRGTGARGETFKKVTYLQLGKYETQDQIEAAQYLGRQSFADPNRIGIFGWSYGGYMSSLCLLKGNDVFKAAIAVAPVTSWKWYDSVYTERYMQTLSENPSGYKDNSPVYFADRLKGNFLLVHGLGDDNVHFQHTAEMTNALINANKQFDTYLYPNRNHGIYGGVVRYHLYNKMTNFLKEKLMNDYATVGQ
jgi:dipeptidyl-peptidase-4